MGLMGSAAIAIWSNYPEWILPEHSEFHSYEHLPERVTVPGFLRGRRCNAVTQGAPTVFALYEVADRGVTVSDAYLERLNNPTPWTALMLPKVNDATRTLCRVVATQGLGTGPCVATARITPDAERAPELSEWIAGTLVPELAGRNTRIAAHFLIRDEDLERPLTTEEIIRAAGAGSGEQDWIVIVEGYSPDGIAAVIADELSAARLAQHGAASAVVQQYRLSHVLTKAELDAELSGPEEKKGIQGCASYQGSTSTGNG